LVVDIAVTSWRASLDARTDEIRSVLSTRWTTHAPAPAVDVSRPYPGWADIDPEKR
jgi:hypothetical protein